MRLKGITVCARQSMPVIWKMAICTGFRQFGKKRLLYRPTNSFFSLLFCAEKQRLFPRKRKISLPTATASWQRINMPIKAKTLPPFARQVGVVGAYWTYRRSGFNFQDRLVGILFFKILSWLKNSIERKTCSVKHSR